MSLEWNSKTIEEICLVTDYVANGSFKSLRENVQYNYEKDYAILLRTTDFTNNFKKSFVYVNENSYKFLKKSFVLPNDIIICNVGSVGLTFLVPEFDYPMTLGPNSILIRPLKKDEINPRFFYYLFISPLGQGLIETITTGTTQLKFNKTNFRKLTISFPSKKNEQKQIVEILDKAFEAIDKAKANLEKNIRNTKELFQSRLNEIFSQKGEGWEEKTLKELTTILGDGLHGTPKYSENDEYYFINGNNLEDGRIILKENTKKVSFQEYEKYKKNLNERTVLVSINGTLGKVAFYNNEKVILGKSACYFNLIEGIDKNFIKFFIQSSFFNNYAHSEATGATIKNVSLKSMRALKINIPCSELLQNKIVHELDNLKQQTKQLEKYYQQKLENLEELKKSILQKAFSGELV